MNISKLLEPLFLFLFLSSGFLYSAPIIQIKSESCNFGKFPANQQKTHHFIISNAGDEILKIGKVRVTCGCSAAQLEKRELRPGESAELIASILPESISGPFSKGIFIHSNASNERIKMITLNGEAVPLLKVTPQKNLYLGSLVVGREFLQEFTVHTAEPVQFDTPSVSGNADFQVSMEKLPNLRFRLSARWQPAQTADRFAITITIPIRHPANWKPLEISMQGRAIKENPEKK